MKLYITVQLTVEVEAEVESHADDMAASGWYSGVQSWKISDTAEQLYDEISTLITDDAVEEAAMEELENG